MLRKSCCDQWDVASPVRAEWMSTLTANAIRPMAAPKTDQICIESQFNVSNYFRLETEVSWGIFEVKKVSDIEDCFAEALCDSTSMYHGFAALMSGEGC